MKAQKVLYKILTYLLLPACIVALVWLNYSSVNKPVEFKKEKERREAVGIQVLKDIRDLQVAYKNVHDIYTDNMDTLINFYNNASIVVSKQLGSPDDTAAVHNTTRHKKVIEQRLQREVAGFHRMPKNRKDSLINVELEKLYRQHENVVVSLDQLIPVKDTLLQHRGPDFDINELAIIPFSGGQKVIMKADTSTVSGVRVSLFEADMPYNALLKGMDRQLIINLNADREAMDKYKGLMVGSVTIPNNNAGNWE